MINNDTLDILLRTLQRNPLRPQGPVGVSPARETQRVADEAAEASGARVPVLRGRQDAVELPEQREGTGHAPDARAGSPSIPLPPTPVSAGPTTRVALSAAGTVLLDALKLSPEHSSPVIRVDQPLLAGPPHTTDALAQAIEHAITRSGLFYESHLARWAAGQFPQGELAREPQALLQPALAASPASTPQAAAQALLPAPTSGEASSAIAAPGEHAAVTAMAGRLLSDQLQTYEGQKLVLMCSVWPGQPATLTFDQGEDTRVHDDDAPDQEWTRTWSTRVDLVLDTLGPVTATISLASDRVRCVLTVASPEAKARLHAARGDFAQVLAQHALTLAQCSIDHER